MKDGDTLVMQNAFDSTKYYRGIYIDLNKDITNPKDVILSVSLLENYDLEIEYISNDNYKTKKVIK